MAAYTRVPDAPSPSAAPVPAVLWGVGVWAAARWLAGLPGRVRAWWTRPVRDPRPLLMPRPPKAADTYGRHGRHRSDQHPRLRPGGVTPMDAVNLAHQRQQIERTAQHRPVTRVQPDWWVQRVPDDHSSWSQVGVIMETENVFTRKQSVRLFVKGTGGDEHQMVFARGESVLCLTTAQAKKARLSVASGDTEVSA